MPGRIGILEALPKQKTRSGNVPPGAPAGTATVLRVGFPRASLVLLLLGPVPPRSSVLLGRRAQSCCLLPFEEQTPLGHRQPEGDEESHALNPQGDGVEVEVVYSC